METIVPGPARQDIKCNGTRVYSKTKGQQQQEHSLRHQPYPDRNLGASSSHLPPASHIASGHLAIRGHYLDQIDPSARRVCVLLISPLPTLLAGRRMFAHLVPSPAKLHMSDIHFLNFTRGRRRCYVTQNFSMFEFTAVYFWTCSTFDRP